MLVCDKCNASINDGSKFCPQCGDAVTETDKRDVITTEQNIANVEIIFGESSSPNFTKALNICKNIPSYSSSKKDNQMQHKVALPITEIELIVNLYDLVGSWKTSSMFANGQIITKKNLTYYGVGCYRSRQKSYDQKQYCFGENEYQYNIWGCKKLEMPITAWYDSWLGYGNFDGEGVWHFDKDRIKHALEQKIKENDLCPVLNRKRILETLENFPNSVNPEEDKKWEYITETRPNKHGNHEKVAVGVKPIIGDSNVYVFGEYKPEYPEYDSLEAKELIITIDDEEELEEDQHNNQKSWMKTALIVGGIGAFLYWLSSK